MKKKKIESVLERMTEASLGQEFTIPLDQIKQDPALYRHRDEADLDPKKETMQALEKSLITDGQRDPILVIKIVPSEGVSEGVAEFQQVTGHRRVAAMRHLAETNVSGFTHDLQVRAREILNGDRHDYLVWSVADNVIREPIDELYRVKATIRLIKEKVDHARIKANLKLSDSTFERIRRLAESPWMLGHVERNEIGLTDAYLLLEVAGGKGGLTALKNLKEDLGRQVAAVARKIEARREELAERHKELKGSGALVKSHFPKHLIQKWVLDLRQGRRIKNQAKFVYGAVIETDKNGKKLTIPAFSAYLVGQEVERLAEVALKLDRVSKGLRAEVNALARQQIALTYYQDEDEPADFASAGLDGVEELLNHRSTRLYPEDTVSLEDREATLREVNENWDREERRIVPATDGLDIPDAQPQTDESDAEE